MDEYTGKTKNCMGWKDQNGQYNKKNNSIKKNITMNTTKLEQYSQKGPIWSKSTNTAKKDQDN